MHQGFFKEDTQTRLLIRKDQSGKVKLVAVDKPKENPDVFPSEEEVVIAKTVVKTKSDRDTSIKSTGVPTIY